LPLDPIDQTSYRYNLDYRAGVRAEMLRLAKQLLSGELSVVAAARALKPFRYAVEPEVADILEVFVGIDSETDSFPLGEVRQGWNPESLKREDMKLAVAERFWHERAMDAGARLVRRLEA
jgi:hypothetical protein